MGRQRKRRSATGVSNEEASIGLSGVKDNHATFSGRVAHFVTRRTRVLWGVLVLLLAAAGALILGRAKLNSDVLDMLPRKFESVGIYKLADREFSSARE